MACVTKFLHFSLAICFPIDIITKAISVARDLPGHFCFRRSLMPTREFFARVPASLVRDSALSPRAKLLYLLLATHADARTGVTYVALGTLERLLGCGRKPRERAQRELAAAGWLSLHVKSCGRGRWGRRVFVVSSCAQTAVGRFRRSGENDQLIFAHSQVSRSKESISAVF